MRKERKFARLCHSFPTAEFSEKGEDERASKSTLQLLQSRRNKQPYLMADKTALIGNNERVRKVRFSTPQTANSVGPAMSGSAAKLVGEGPRPLKRSETTFSRGG